MCDDLCQKIVTDLNDQCVLEMTMRTWKLDITQRNYKNVCTNKGKR